MIYYTRSQGFWHKGQYCTQRQEVMASLYTNPSIHEVTEDLRTVNGVALPEFMDDWYEGARAVGGY